MSITVRCPGCSREHAAPESALGRRVRCRSCGHVQRVVPPDVRPPEPTAYELGPPPVRHAPPPTRPRDESPRLEKRDGRRRAEALRVAVFEESQVQGLACGLVALSAADVFMTFTLLRTSPRFFESNPVAMWFFARWNMAGMAIYKFALIGFVIAASELIERKRPGWGRFVLLIGCVGAFYAVYTGLKLYLGHATGPAG